MKKEALFWKKGMGESISCGLCRRKCIIDNGHAGWCGTRLNQYGTLYTLTYGNVAAISVAPIEKKPMFNFFPGTLWLSLGGLGCNFRCQGCLSWDFSHCDVNKSLSSTTYMTPEMVVRKAKKNRCKGIAFTYNEPTMWFEFVIDVFKLAKEEGLSTCYVTNGYMLPEPLEMLSRHTDGFCLDVKGAFMESYARISDIDDVNIIFANGSAAKRKYAMHVEIVTNLIPGYNSNDKEIKEIASWIFAELGKDTPWHLTRFFPYGHLKEVAPTPISLLEETRKTAMEEGIHYVYISNVPGHNAIHTYCQTCKKVVIRRKDYDEIEIRLKEGRCGHCGALIFGRFQAN
ncbi:MAG: AmmeMemoRadiSam system radical SAM enzyme [Candidatus Omnitrophota bacterium]